jgi:hypothetical protein
VDNEACVAGSEEKNMRMITRRTIHEDPRFGKPGNNELLTLLVIFL